VKVADFGLAKSSRNDVTMGIGTPAYMAPEQFNDDDDTAEPLKLDIYALGVIIWELWTRSPPFKGQKKVQKILQEVMNGKRPNHKPPNFIEPPSFVTSLVNQCWDGLPSKRPNIDYVMETFEVESLVYFDVSQRYSDNLKGASTDQNKYLQTTDDASSLPTMDTTGNTMNLKPMRNTMVLLKDFLAEVELSHHLSKLKEQGFTDLESLCDREILTDEILMRDIQMTKLDIRKMRLGIEAKGLSMSLNKNYNKEAFLSSSKLDKEEEEEGNNNDKLQNEKAKSSSVAGDPGSWL
jgi:serine/threonine protein kinase